MDKEKGLWGQINEGIHDACYIWAKEMKATVKDEGVLIFFFLVPLFYPLLYSWAYNNETIHNVPVAVVDMSHSQMSRQFIREYNASPDVKSAGIYTIPSTICFCTRSLASLMSLHL